MKKFILSILLLSIFPMLISCGGVSAESNEVTFLATVKSVSDKIEVEADEGQNEFGVYLIVTTSQTKYYDKNGNKVNKWTAGEWYTLVIKPTVKLALEPFAKTSP